MYQDHELKEMLASALTHPEKVAEEERAASERKAAAEAEAERARSGQGTNPKRGASVWKGIRATVRTFGGINRVHSIEGIEEAHDTMPLERLTSSPLAQRS